MEIKTAANDAKTPTAVATPQQQIEDKMAALISAGSSENEAWDQVLDELSEAKHNMHQVLEWTKAVQLVFHAIVARHGLVAGVDTVDPFAEYIPHMQRASNAVMRAKNVTTQEEVTSVRGEIDSLLQEWPE